MADAHIHKLRKLNLQQSRGGYYRYECMDCGRRLKIASGILVALTDTEAEAYLDRKRQRQKGEENGQR